MEKCKKYVRAILYLVGAAVILVGGIMFLINQLQPLVGIGMGERDKLLLVLLSMNCCWMIYIIYIYQNYKQVRQQTDASISKLEKPLIIVNRTTYFLGFYDLALVGVDYATVRNESLVMLFLQSVLIAILLIMLIMNHEISFRLALS